MINDPYIAEQIFKPEDYDLILMDFRMPIMKGFGLYIKLNDLSIKVQYNVSSSNDFRVCCMTTSRINYTALAEIYPELREENYVYKENTKEDFKI